MPSNVHEIELIAEKHQKVEDNDEISLLKSNINLASGTANRWSGMAWKYGWTALGLFSLLIFVDLLQFYFQPMNLKIDHVELFLSSPLVRQESDTSALSSSDMKARFHLSFESGSTLFSSGLRASSCDFNYLSFGDASTTNQHLTTVKMSDVKLNGKASMFASHKTQETVTFDIQNTDFVNIQAAVRNSLFTADGEQQSRNFIVADCSTSLSYGAMSVPYKLQRMVSLASYQDELHSELRVVQQAFSANFNQSLANVVELIKTAVGGEESASSPSPKDTQSRRLSSLLLPYESVYKSYVETYNSYLDYFGYVVSYAVAMSVSLSVAHLYIMCYRKSTPLS